MLCDDCDSSEAFRKVWNHEHCVRRTKCAVQRPCKSYVAEVPHEVYFCDIQEPEDR